MRTYTRQKEAAAGLKNILSSAAEVVAAAADKCSTEVYKCIHTDICYVKDIQHSSISVFVCQHSQTAVSNLT